MSSVHVACWRGVIISASVLPCMLLARQRRGTVDPPHASKQHVCARQRGILSHTTLLPLTAFLLLRRYAGNDYSKIENFVANEDYEAAKAEVLSVLRQADLEDQRPLASGGQEVIQKDLEKKRVRVMICL